jgi:6-phosphogluconolactonase
MTHIEVIEPMLFAGVVADEIVSSIQEAIDERGVCNISLAGGSTPSTIYRLLAKPPRVENIDWKNVKLFWGDERWVPQADTQSNFNMVQETLLSQLPADAPQVFPVDTSQETPAMTAEKYSQLLTTELGKDGLFDLMLLGVGEDGHTASLFPGSPHPVDSQGPWCVATLQPEEQKPRISLSPRAILAARRILFLVKGESKAEIVARVIEGTESTAVLPACLFREAQDQVYFFLDSAAGLKLRRRN